MSAILIVEDNATIAEGVRKNLEVEGHAVTIAPDGETAIEAVRVASPDLVILDLMLPDTDGFDVLGELRSRGCASPVLILSARGGEPDKLKGFRLGADDYVTKPFSVLELLARVTALIRRHQFSVSRGLDPRGPVRFGDVEVVLSQRRVRKGGMDIELRPREFDLLAALVRHVNQVVSRKQLLQEVWGYSPGVYSRTVDTHLAELRRKLEHNPAVPRHLLTIRGGGYALQLDEGAVRRREARSRTE